MTKYRNKKINKWLIVPQHFYAHWAYKAKHINILIDIFETLNVTNITIELWWCIVTATLYALTNG